MNYAPIRLGTVLSQRIANIGGDGILDEVILEAEVPIIHLRFGFRQVRVKLFMAHDPW